MKLFRILKIEKARQDKVYDIEHLKNCNEFWDTQPNLIAEGMTIANCGRHAGGIYIGVNALDQMPLIVAGKGDKRNFQTPFSEGVNIRELEELGFLKFDILGVGTLKIVENTIKRILKKEGISYPTHSQVREWHRKYLHPDAIDMDDQNVYKNVFWDEKYCTIFQFAEKDAKRLMKEIKPNCFNDIVASISINRPGPMSLNVNKDYINNKSNPDKIQYKHPLLKDCLSDSHGTMLYQEQLQLIYHKLAGVPLDDTDGVRKSFTKKDVSNKEKAAKERDELKIDFLKRCKDTNGIPEETSSEIFEFMQKLVQYTFNRSHAAAYAALTYQCAFLQTYHTDEWVASCLDHASTEKGKAVGKEDPKAVTIKEAKSLGYVLSKGDINKSSKTFVVENNEIIPSFASLKYVGKTVVDEIERFRPYKIAEDLLINQSGTWRHSKFNKRALSTLISLEALDSLDLVGEGKQFKHYKQLHHVLIENYDLLKRTSARKKNNDVRAVLKKLIEESIDMPDWSTEEKMAMQQELAGSVDFSLIVPEEVQEELYKEGIVTIDNWTPDSKCWAVVSSVALATTKTGKPYLKLKLFGESMKEHMCMIWNYKGTGKGLKQNDVVVAEFTGKTDFGFSTFPNKIQKINKDQWLS